MGFKNLSVVALMSLLLLTGCLPSGGGWSGAIGEDTVDLVARSGLDADGPDVQSVYCELPAICTETSLLPTCAYTG